MTELSKKYELLTSSSINKCCTVIKELLANEHINASELARRIELPQPTIHRLLTGKTEDPKLSTISRIAGYFQISLDQLLGHAALSLHGSKAQAFTPISIPVISWNNAQNIDTVLPSLTIYNCEKWLILDTEASALSFGLKSKKSMEPRFPTGTTLIIDPRATPIDGDLVVVHYKGTNEATIRTLVLDGPKQELHSIFDYTKSDKLDNNIKLIGVVIQTRFLYKQKT